MFIITSYETLQLFSQEIFEFVEHKEANWFEFTDDVKSVDDFNSCSIQTLDKYADVPEFMDDFSLKNAILDSLFTGSLLSLQ